MKKESLNFTRLFMIVALLIVASLSASLTHATGLDIHSSTQFKVEGNIALNVGGDLNIFGTLNASDGTITVDGDWSNSGTFQSGKSAVVFNGTSTSLSGNTTFYDLVNTKSEAATMKFSNGDFFTVSNLLKLHGASGQLLKLRSTSDGSQYFLTLVQAGLQSLEFLDIKDGNASQGQRLLPVSSVNSGNLSNIFPAEDDVVVPGTVNAEPNAGGGSATTTTTSTTTTTVNIVSTTTSTSLAVTTTTITVTVPTTTTTIPQAITGISGQVVDSDGDPVLGVTVELYDASSVTNTGIDNDSNFFINALLVNGASTAGDGTYFVEAPPGSYIVLVNTLGTSFIAEFYNDALVFENSEVVNVVPETITENIDFVLNQELTITGSVVSLNGNPFVDVVLTAFDSTTGEVIGFALTDENGVFSLFIPEGTYNFRVDLFGTIFEVAVNIPVNSSTASGSFDFVVSASFIKGKVTDLDNKSVSDLFVKVFNEATGDLVNFDKTDENGEYLIPVLKGNYRVIVDVTGTNFNPVSEMVDVVDVDVIVNFVMLENTAIKGQVMNVNNEPIQGLRVNAFDFVSGNWISESEPTDAEGSYSVPVLAGSYKVGVNTANTEFATQYFDNSDWDNAKSVTVVGNEDAININFVLEKPSFISGLVTDGTDPLNNILITVTSFETGTWIGQALTNINGSYTVFVNSGLYKVEADGIGEGFSNVYFDGKDEAAADSVLVNKDESVLGVDFELKAGSSISGVVTSEGNLLSGIEIDAFAFEGNTWISGTITSFNGEYRVDRLPVGEYRLKASDPDGVFTTQYYNNVETSNLATSVAVIKDQVTTGVDFDLTSGGFVLGRVAADSDLNNALEAITVEAYDSNSGLGINSSDTNSIGDYLIPLPIGEYKLRAFDISGTFTSEYFDNSQDWNSANSVLVKGGEESLNVDFSLLFGNIISGVVEDDKRKLLKDVSIDIFDFETGNWLSSVKTDVEGEYKIVMPTGRYRVTATPDDLTLAPGVYNNAPGWDKATPVSVSEIKEAKNINFKLSSSVAIIKGKVVDSKQNALPNIVVKAYDFDSKLWITDDNTNGNGEFIMALIPGRYRIQAIPLATNSVITPEYYNDKDNWDLATVVEAVVENENLLDDIVLDNGHAITGNVSSESGIGLGDIAISVYKFLENSWVTGVVTNNNGKYTLNGLPNGSYRLKATPPAALGLAGLYYDGSFDWDGATPLVVNNSDIDNVDFKLSAGGVIAGHVIDATNQVPISGMDVDVFNFETGAWVDKGTTDGIGNYTISVLAGVYRVRANASGSEFVDEFFDNVVDTALASPVVVTNDIDAIADFRLTPGGTIAGLVKDESDNVIAGAEANIFDFDTNAWINNSFTDSNGEYSLNVLFGKYRIEIKAPVGSNFADLIVPDLIEVTDSSRLVLPGFVLVKGRGGIVGNVVNRDKAVLEGIKIVAFEGDTSGELGFDKGDTRATTFTDENGDYLLSLSPGNYRLCATGEGTTTTYITKYFDGVNLFGSSTVINLGADETENADFELNSGSCISGRVTIGENLRALVGIRVRAFKSDSREWFGGDTTDANGNYSICLPNGIYRLVSWIRVNNEIEWQFFNKTKNLDLAKDIVLDGEDRDGIDFNVLKLD